jgi:hypothetical protein
MIKKVVVYPYIYSFLLVSYTNRKVEYIKDTDNQFQINLSYALKSFFLGWWSPRGLFKTPWAIFKCLSGGIDVSHIYKKYEDNPQLHSVNFETFFWKEYHNKWFV